MSDDQIYYADYCETCASSDRYCVLHDDEEGEALKGDGQQGDGSQDVETLDIDWGDGDE